MELYVWNCILGAVILAGTAFLDLMNGCSRGGGAELMLNDMISLLLFGFKKDGVQQCCRGGAGAELMLQLPLFPLSVSPLASSLKGGDLDCFHIHQFLPQIFSRFESLLLQLRTQTKMPFSPLTQ